MTNLICELTTIEPVGRVPKGRQTEVFDEAARVIQRLSRDDRPSISFAVLDTVDIPLVITDAREHDNPIVYANAAFSKLTGFAVDEVIGRNCRFLQGPKSASEAAARLKAAIRARLPIEVELLNYKKDGSTFWNKLLMVPILGEDGLSDFFLASQMDVTLERNSALLPRQNLYDGLGLLEPSCGIPDARDDRIRVALSAGRLGSWTLNIGTYDLLTCETCKSVYGRNPSEQFSYEQLESCVHPEDRSRRSQAIRRAIDDKTDLELDFRIVTPSGHQRWIYVCGRANHRADGSPLSLAGIAQDITVRRQAEEHRALLANELSHRVKNILASLQAIASQTLRRASSLQEAAGTLEARIHAMAAANDLLITGKFDSTSLRDVLFRALAPFGIEDGRRFRLEGSDVRLSPRAVIAFALALHELATNATKYGALSTEDGVVSISWKILGEPRGDSLHFEWIERGGPQVRPPKKASFGMLLIRRALAREIGGTAEMWFPAEGLGFKTVAPLYDTEPED